MDLPFDVCGKQQNLIQTLGNPASTAKMNLFPKSQPMCHSKKLVKTEHDDLTN